MNDYDISSVYKDMEDYLISSMSRNMRRHTNWEKEEGFQWDMWQAKQLESLNGYRKSNITYISKQTNLIKLKIEELLKQSNEHGGMQEEIKILNAIKKGFKPGRTPKGIEGSFFKANDRKLRALIEATTSDVQKGSNTMLRMTNDEYRKTIFKAQVFANTGTMTTDQAIDMATKDFLSRGINCIEYANGARVNIASYAEMAIKTANKRAYLQGEGSKRAEWGIHTVLVSRYGACSATCMPHQGKVYIDDVWSGGTAEESESTGYLLLSTAISGGLFHPNCKHTMTTYFEGISTIPGSADVKGTSENSNVIATQRYNERMIRKYKRLENGSLDNSNKERYRGKVREWQNRNNELVKAHPEMHRNYKREGLRGVTELNTGFNDNSQVIAQNLIEIAKAKDKIITGELIDAVKSGTGKLEGISYRVKGLESLQRKLISKAKVKSIPVSEYSKQVTDVLRFTNCSNADTLVSDYFLIVDNLAAKGYNMEEVTNTFNTPGLYKGINTLVKDKDGYVFELQFHTPESLEVKEINHKLYEERRLDTTSSKRKEELDGLMRTKAQSVKAPNGVDKIQNKVRRS